MTEAKPIPRKPTRVPIIMSAFVCPGAGQCMQGRWMAGIFYFFAFIAAVVMYFKTMCTPLIANLRASIDMANGVNCEFVEQPFMCGIQYLALMLAVYFLNVLSTWRYYLKQHSKWREAKLMRDIEQSQNPKQPPPLP